MENNTGKRKIMLIAISVLIAMATWFMVDSASSTEVTITISDIMVEYVGEETALAERGLLLLDDSDQYVTLQLRGVRSLISKLDPDQMRVEADLSSITEVGVQSVTCYEIFPNSEFSSITVVDKSPYAIKVSIGDLFSKEIPVRYEIQGAVAEGYSAGAIELSLESFEIRGLQETIEQVSYAKVVLEIDEATRSVSETLSYEYYDAQGNVVDGTDIQSDVSTIDITMPVNITKQLRLVVDFVEAPGASLENVEYTLSPSTVSVTGDAELLERINVIVLESFDLLELSGNTTYNYVIELPEGVENLSGYTRATMEISFIDMNNSTILSSNYVVNNVPDGKVATVLSDSVGVRVFGTSADVSAILPDDFTLTIDMSDYSGASGTYTVPVEVTLDTDGDIGLLGTYQVQVNLADEPEPEEELQESEDDTSSNG
ncbi:CdaR family protein [Bengtsoniella intestinalis]|uniref:CdaR family protein n=1 Tax=Bengtsoniella intestinalis TaxID=3073143 RepID=UPI00391F3321